MKSMKKTKTMKRLALDALCAALIAVMMCSPVFAATAPSDFTTDANGLMAYHAPRTDYAEYGYDFMGYVNGQWRQVTYNGTEQPNTSFLGYSGFKAGVYREANTESTGNLDVTTADPKFIAGGKAIQMEYTVKNNTQATISNYRFYIAADTTLNGNDASSNEVKGNALIMTSGDISFFALSKTGDCTLVPTDYEANNDRFEAIRSGNADPSTAESATSIQDSALVMYYPEETLAAGAEKTYTIVVGMGNASDIDDIIDDIKGDTTPAEKSPATDDNSNLALWLALLFVSGGAVAGGAVAKKRSLNR